MSEIRCDNTVRRQAVQRPVAAFATIWLILFGGACAPSPAGSSEAIGVTIIELSDAITSLRHDQALLQEEIDSLRAEVARQDSMVRQISNLAGVPR